MSLFENPAARMWCGTSLRRIRQYYVGSAPTLAFQPQPDIAHNVYTT
jgi:hypothetical protein